MARSLGITSGQPICHLGTFSGYLRLFTCIRKNACTRSILSSSVWNDLCKKVEHIALENLDRQYPSRTASSRLCTQSVRALRAAASSSAALGAGAGPSNAFWAVSAATWAANVATTRLPSSAHTPECECQVTTDRKAARTDLLKSVSMAWTPNFKCTRAPHTLPPRNNRPAFLPNTRVVVSVV
jgi:hypothetical protein